MIQTQINFEQTTELNNAISFEEAESIHELKKLTDHYEKLKEAARYLYGKRKGAWGRITYADEKRSAKLDNLKGEIGRAQLIHNLKYKP